MKRKAFWAWSLVLIATSAWVSLILLAPLASAFELNGVSNPVYSFYGYICHQIPSRSFHLAGHQFAVCSRCFGVYFGLVAGLIAYPFFRSMDEIEPLPRIFLFLSLVPMAVDWSLGFFDIWENNHFSRVATGLILGIACAVFIVPALVELSQILPTKRREQTAL